MINLYVLPTENSSRLSYSRDGRLELHRLQWRKNTQYIYITSDEKIKEGDWIIWNKKIVKAIDTDYYSAKKIILTTDQDLIKDGVQAIPDEFLEWFVKNPSCEEVEVEGHIYKGQDETEYKIIIPKEEPKQTVQEYEQQGLEKYSHELKQETLEEDAEKWVFETNGQKWSNNDDTAGDNYGSFIAGYKLAQERMYSEEEVIWALLLCSNKKFKNSLEVKEWWDNFQKK